MRVFVLCTGRCGSTTFMYACKHMTNFTAGHETRAKFIGFERLNYPDNHIEIDNRLSWCLGRLEQTYGDTAYYVHLTRAAAEVAKSYAKRMANPASIGAAHKRSILMNSPYDDLEICVDVVETMVSNIETFLRDKTHVMQISLESVEQDFAEFWHWIGAEGDLTAALSEWKTDYNDSETAYGAIRPTVPRTELAELREKHHKLRMKSRRLEDAVAQANEKLDGADQRYREASTRLRISEQRCLELDTRIAKIEELWKEEIDRLRKDLSTRDHTIAELLEKLDTSRKRFAADLGEVSKQRDAFVDYADELKERYLSILKSRTWRAFGPYRFLMRKIRGLLVGSPLPPNSLPVRPSLAGSVQHTPKRARPKKLEDVSSVRKLDKRLWGGFSRSALLELRAYEGNVQKPLNERSEAAYNLARWYSVQGDFERALEEIRNMRSLCPECAEEPRQYLPEALFLCRLGKAHEARDLLESASRGFDPTAQLMLANTWNPEVAGTSTLCAEANVLAHLNCIYDHFGVAAIEKRDPEKPLSIDNLQSALPGRGHFDHDSKVTVIVPVFNAEDTIVTALTSVAEQTWQNLEVLVVDDSSTDRSVEIIADFCASDRRFRLIRQSQNGGSYVCRNRALEEASGAFITVHDSDDWSHPDKIHSQIKDLRERPGPYNLAMWVRTTSALSFFGNSRTLHDLVRSDHSSGLFPKATFERFGAWDAVRISADTELYWRIESALGNKKWMFNRRHVLKGCPLSFGRMSTTSLTQAGVTSVMTIYHGLRREYRDAADFWHSWQRRVTDHSPSTRRQPFFPVPVLMGPSESTPSRLSVLLIANWNSADDLLEAAMRALVQSAPDGGDARAGLLHYPGYDGDVSAPLSHEVRGFAWENDIRIVAPGETVEAGVVIVLTPSVFEHAMDRFPQVTHDRLVIVARQEQNVQSSEHGDNDDPSAIKRHLAELLGHEGEWICTLEDVEHVLRDSLRPRGVNETMTSATVGANSGFD